MNVIRSPFFYVGDKYKLMPQLRQLMPDHIEAYIEPFVGGGSSFLNTRARQYRLNDIDRYVIQLHRELGKYAKDPDLLFTSLFSAVDSYGLSCSYRNINVSEELKKQYVKTYYAKYNKESYMQMRQDFNENQDNIILLYLLLIYGFNHMIRFNKSGKFNLPVGNVDFNQNVYQALNHYLNFRKEHDIDFDNQDYMEFMESIVIKSDDYVFLDPPYLISMSEYNKLWNEEKEKELCQYLDLLNRKGIRFGITNLITHKGKINHTFLEWSKKYLSYNIKSNYISFNDNTIKEDSREVFVTNFRK